MSPAENAITPRLRRPVRHAGVALIVATVVAIAACGSPQPSQQAQKELDAGLAADALGNVDEAAQHYRACLKVEPLNQFCIFNLGVQAQNAGRALEAENAYRLALLQNPDFPQALFNLAIVRNNAGATTEAIELYRHLVEVDPGNAAAHLNLGLLLVATGQVEEGKAHLSQAVSLDGSLTIPSPLPIPSSSPATP
jgi:tetratricopeptide (TPR) repeat protein